MSLTGMFFRFARSFVRHQWARLCGYMILAPGGIQAYRETQCRKCEFNLDEQCQKCGCLVISKVMMAVEKCPAGKWNSAWIKRKP